MHAMQKSKETRLAGLPTEEAPTKLIEGEKGKATRGQKRRRNFRGSFVTSSNYGRLDDVG